MERLRRASPGRGFGTALLAGLTAFVLVLSVPASLEYARQNRGLYLFSRAFVEDIPKRLTGPGRFRFVVQPMIAMALGIRSGLADARAGKPAYLRGAIFHRGLRGELLKTGFAQVAKLLLTGILLDSGCQWLILGISYPGAALVVGPVLIMAPYTLARAFSNRFAR